MPWHEKAMKDVISCDKPREVANTLWSGDVRMGKPGRGHALSLHDWIHRLRRANGGNWNI